MIYGYLRVSTDDQDVNSQKQGVESFATEKNWKIDEYITDEGVSGGTDPDKRNLGPLLTKLKKEDKVIASEISRLGRDLYMVMDILHFCMKEGVIVYTVKDRFILGDDVQSKVLAFAFGLSAEIERQMIKQRTREGLRLRMKMGILLGRPIGRRTSEPKLDQFKNEILNQYKIGVPFRRIAINFHTERNSLARRFNEWGITDIKWLKAQDEKLRKQRRQEIILKKSLKYNDEEFKIVDLPRDTVTNLILLDNTIPEICNALKIYSYEQVYDSILCDEEWNKLYRVHGMKKIPRRNPVKK